MRPRLCNSTLPRKVPRLVAILLFVAWVTGSHTAKADELYPELNAVSLQQAIKRAELLKPGREKLFQYLTIGYQYVYRCNENVLDSAQLFINKAHKLCSIMGDKQGILETDILFAAMKFMGQQNAIAEKQIHTVVAECRRQGYTRLEGVALYTHGAFLDIKERFQYYHKAVALLEKAGDKYGTAFLYKSIAELYFFQPAVKNQDAGIKTALQALEVYKTIKGHNLHYIYYRLADFCHRRSRYADAITYGLLDLNELKTATDTSDYADAYFRVADSYRLVEDTLQAFHYYKLALASARSQQNTSLIYHIAFMGAEAYVRAHLPEKALLFYLQTAKGVEPESDDEKLGSAQFLTRCYVRLQQYEKAEKHCKEMIAIDEAIDKAKPAHVRSSYHNNTAFQAGEFYLATKQLVKARFYFEKFLADDKINNVASRNAIQGHLYKIDSLEGNYLGALQHFQAAKILADTMLDEAKSRQIIAFQTLYGVQQKDLQLKLKEEEIKVLDQQNRLDQQNSKMQEDKLMQASLLAQRNSAELKLKEKSIGLLNQQTTLQQAAIRNKELQRNIIIGTAVALLLLLMLVWILFTNKRRSNRELKVQQAEISYANKSLQQLVEEKEWLLKEVHHRVKNNLQMVISLLESQSSHLHNDAFEAMQKGRNRIYTISLIHQKLYQSNELKTIDMSCFIPELVKHLKECFDAGSHICFRLDIVPMESDVAIALPLGLIINEAVTNSLKYAFKNRQTGEITILLHRCEKQQYRLVIADNGTGIPAQALQKAESMGMKLIRGLSSQIDAALTIENSDGAKITLTLENARNHDYFNS